MFLREPERALGARTQTALPGGGAWPGWRLPPPLQGVEARSAHLYWIVSEVVEARNFVIRILTMLNRKIKLIWREGAGREKGRTPR